MQYPCSSEQNANQVPCTLDSKATVYFSVTDYSSRPISEINQKPESSNIDIEGAESSNIEEAESSIRESDSLNNEEARAVLGRYEYQKGNIESALHVFGGIDMAAVTPKIKMSLNELKKPQRHSRNYAAPPFSVKTVGLLLEAAYFKSKSLQHFGTKINEKIRSEKVDNF